MSTNTNSGGISLPMALLLIFVTLKLTGHITWSWLWVLSPIWIPLAIVVVCGLLVFAIAYWMGS